jgi:phosphoglucomutase
MDAEQRYDRWLRDDAVDEKTKEIMRKMTKEEISDAFYKDLEFGTGGIRGILGVGTNRMNEYVIGKVSYALGKIVASFGEEAKKQGIVIAYDVRHRSREFALHSALIFCAMGIKVYYFDDIRATPQLSFAVRRTNAKAGIMVTASHNPKEYNGYKAYWDDGAQILPDFADKIEALAKKIKSFGEIEKMEESEARQKGLLVSPDPVIDDEYINNVKSLALNDDIDKDISIVYTSLHGTGTIPVRRVLKERGFRNISVVEQQSVPDPDFTYAPFPNPEDIRAFELAMELGKEKNASLLIANDPDCDRTAIMVNDGAGYVFLNGNQTGAVLIKYMMDALVEKNMMPEKAMVVKTIVTGDMGRVIAADYGVTTFETLTGFKNISSIAIEKEENEGYKFLFGYEESIGYNAGTFVRDKDGVTSAMLISEAAAFYMKKGQTLYDVLMELYKKYGYYTDNNFSITLKGREGTEKIKKIMMFLREKGIDSLANKKVVALTDYKKGYRYDFTTKAKEDVDIPDSDVLKFEAEDELWFAVRPSGTEPKLKVYIYGRAQTEREAKELVENAGEEIDSILREFSA